MPSITPVFTLYCRSYPKKEDKKKKEHVRMKGSIIRAKPVTELNKVRKGRRTGYVDLRTVK